MAYAYFSKSLQFVNNCSSFHTISSLPSGKKRSRFGRRVPRREPAAKKVDGAGVPQPRSRPGNHLPAPAARLPELPFHPRPSRSGALEAAARRRCLQAQIRAPYGSKPRPGRRGVASGPLGLLRDQLEFAAELPMSSARSAQCQMAGAEPPPPWHAAPRGLWTVGSRRSPRPEALDGESLRNRGRVPSRYSWTGLFSERARP